MARKREIDYYQEFLQDYSISDIIQFPLQGVYYYKLDAQQRIRFVGVYNPNYQISGQPVKVRLSENQQVSLNIDDDQRVWGFFRYNDGYVVSAYRGYLEACQKLPQVLQTENCELGRLVCIEISREVDEKGEDIWEQ